MSLAAPPWLARIRRLHGRNFPGGHRAACQPAPTVADSRWVSKKRLTVAGKPRIQPNSKNFSSAASFAGTASQATLGKAFERCAHGFPQHCPHRKGKTCHCAVVSTAVLGVRIQPQAALSGHGVDQPLYFAPAPAGTAAYSRLASMPRERAAESGQKNTRRSGWRGARMGALRTNRELFFYCGPVA